VRARLLRLYSRRKEALQISHVAFYSEAVKAFEEE
jgi:hypothetical protein